VLRPRAATQPFTMPALFPATGWRGIAALKAVAGDKVASPRIKLEPMRSYGHCDAGRLDF